jgi:hypothetical protein
MPVLPELVVGLQFRLSGQQIGSQHVVAEDPDEDAAAGGDVIGPHAVGNEPNDAVIEQGKFAGQLNVLVTGTSVQISPSEQL